MDNLSSLLCERNLLMNNSLACPETKQITLDSLHQETTTEDIFIKNEIYIVKLDFLTLTVENAKKL